MTKQELTLHNRAVVRSFNREVMQHGLIAGGVLTIQQAMSAGEKALKAQYPVAIEDLYGFAKGVK